MQDNGSCYLIPSEHPPCPNCGEAERIIPIYYGLQNLDAIELEQAGKLEWGSRFYRPGADCWRCRTCGQSFGEG